MRAAPAVAIGPAGAEDAARVEEVVARAYRPYIARIGKPPGPMLDDYRQLIAERRVWTLREAADIRGILVLLPRPDHLLLDNIAVDPAHHGRGFGRRLLAFAEGEAARQRFSEIRLYTHVMMHENIALYRRLGYEETGRGEEAGYSRVFMRKRLAPSRARQGADG